jgi:two-component system response regulator YesN
MYTLIVIDDEPIIREGIIKMVGRLPQWRLIGECDNGKHALSLVQEFKPDLIISDIRMPLMDGLNLLEQLRSIGMQTLVVLLTGYPDFEYAQRGLRSSAFDYLLKPCSASSLIETLNKAEERIEQTRSQIRDHEVWLSDQLLRSLLYSKETDKYDYSNIPFYGDSLHIIAVSITAAKPILEILGNTISDCLNMIQFRIIPNGVEELLLAISFLPDEHLSMQEELKRILFSVKESLLHAYPMPWKAGIGGQFPIWEGASMSYVQSKLAVNLASQQFPVLAFNEIQQHQSSLFVIPAELEVTLISAIKKGVLDEVNAVYDELSGYLGRLSHTELFTTIHQLQLRIANGIGAEFGFIEFDSISRTLNNEQAILLLAEKIRTWTNWSHDITRLHLGAIVQRAIHYIHENYAKDITLVFIAQKIRMNPSYLSVLFKQETGKTFSEYLTTYRMEQAIGLLKQGDLKIYQIAQQVGYVNGRHFSQNFRKFSDQTPNEYRVSLSLALLEK